MTLTLSPADVAQIERALSQLLSSSRYETLGHWRRAARETLVPLLALVRDGNDADGLKDRRRLVLRLLRPALRAGVTRHLSLRRQLDSLRRVVDRLVEGAAVYDVDGRLIHQNAALARLAADEPERELLTEELARTARILAALGCGGSRGRSSGSDVPPRELSTAAGRYVIRGTCTGCEPTGGSCMIVVLVERAKPLAPPRRVTRERYRLTRREQQVAGLLGAGRSTAEVAHALGVSIHTVRRHSENLLSKLGVHSRAAALAKLRAE